MQASRWLDSLCGVGHELRDRKRSSPEYLEENPFTGVSTAIFALSTNTSSTHTSSSACVWTRALASGENIRRPQQVRRSLFRYYVRGRALGLVTTHTHVLERSRARELPENKFASTAVKEGSACRKILANHHIRRFECRRTREEIDPETESLRDENPNFS